MANPKDVQDHFDVSRSVKDTRESHAHPHGAVPVRISKESNFAAPGLDTPAEMRRPRRAPGTSQDHPVNRPIRSGETPLAPGGSDMGKHVKSFPVTSIGDGNSSIAEPPPRKV